MIKKIIMLSALGVTLSGCFMAPIALIGPATQGFSTASLVQYGATQTASYIVKVGTGSSIGSHAYNIIQREYASATKHALQQTLAPKNKK